MCTCLILKKAGQQEYRKVFPTGYLFNVGAKSTAAEVFTRTLYLDAAYNIHIIYKWTADIKDGKIALSTIWASNVIFSTSFCHAERIRHTLFTVS